MRKAECHGPKSVKPSPPCISLLWDDAALFGAFLTTAGPEPRAVQSIRGEPGSAANRQAFASPYYLAIPQELHDPHFRQIDFRMSKNTRAARRPFASAAARACVSHQIAKNPPHEPDILSLDRIARLLRVSPEE